MRDVYWIALLLIAVAISACSSEGGTAVTIEEGEAQLTLRRSSTSAVPEQATNAIVRLWNPDTDFNRVRDVEIPDPGQSTTVSLSAPAGGGYLAGVLAHTGGSSPLVLAAGKSATFTIEHDATASVEVSVNPWEISLTEAPEQIIPGTEATIHAAVTGAPIDGYLGERFGATFCWDTSPPLPHCPIATTPIGAITENGIDITFIAPDVNGADSLYFGFVMGIDGRVGWDPPSNVAGRVELPQSELGGQPFALPVGEGSGTVQITF